jgi:hypothetical protein
MAENGALNFPIFAHKISPVDDYGPSVRYLEGLNMKGRWWIAQRWARLSPTRARIQASGSRSEAEREKRHGKGL